MLNSLCPQKEQHLYHKNTTKKKPLDNIYFSKIHTFVIL